MVLEFRFWSRGESCWIFFDDCQHGGKSTALFMRRLQGVGVCTRTGKVENSLLRWGCAHRGQGDNIRRIRPLSSPSMGTFTSSRKLHSDFNLALLPKSHNLSPGHELPYHFPKNQWLNAFPREINSSLKTHVGHNGLVIRDPYLEETMQRPHSHCQAKARQGGPSSNPSHQFLQFSASWTACTYTSDKFQGKALTLNGKKMLKTP